MCDRWACLQFSVKYREIKGQTTVIKNCLTAQSKRQRCIKEEVKYICTKIYCIYLRWWRERGNQAREVDGNETDVHRWYLRTIQINVALNLRNRTASALLCVCVCVRHFYVYCLAAKAATVYPGNEMKTEAEQQLWAQKPLISHGEERRDNLVERRRDNLLFYFDILFQGLLINIALLQREEEMICVCA